MFRFGHFGERLGIAKDIMIKYVYIVEITNIFKCNL